MSLRFNTYRAKRYLRSRFVEGKYLLASEASDLQLESLQILRKAIEKSLGAAVAVGDAWKVELLSPTEILIKPGEAWVKGLPFAMRTGKDQLVSGAVLSIGIVPVGVSVSDEPNGDGKILTFNDGATTPTNSYRLTVSAQEELITDVDDPFLKNLNLTESTAQKVRLNYKLNLVPVSLQSTSPVPYRDETSTSGVPTNFPNTGGVAAPNLSNEVIVTPGVGLNGELISTALVTGSEGIDGRDVEIVIRNDGTIGGGIILPNSPVGQHTFSNSTLIDSTGNSYHVNAIFNDTISTQLVIRVDKEVDQPNPQIINGMSFRLIKHDVFVTDDVNGSPQGKVYWDVADLTWHQTNEFVHPSNITDLRKTLTEAQYFQEVVNQKFDLKTVDGGTFDWNGISSLLTWSADIKIVNPYGPEQTITSNSIPVVEGGTLHYKLNLSGGTIELGQLPITVTAFGATSTLAAAALGQIRVGNIVVDSAGTVAEITAINDVNNSITTSPALTANGAATVHLDSYGPGKAPLSELSYVLATRYNNKVYVAGNLELEDGEQNQLGDGITSALLAFIGSTDENDGSPNYGTPNYISNGDSLVTAIAAIDAALFSLSGVVGALSWKAPVANYAALPAVGNVDGDVRLTLDTRVAYSWDNANTVWKPLNGTGGGIKIIGGGTIAWNSGTGDLTFSSNMFLEMKGLAYADNTLPTSASPINLPTSLDVAYVIPNLVTGGPALSVTVGTLGSVPANAIIIARRVGTDVIVGSSSTRLKNGQSTELYAQSSNQTLTYIGAPDSADSTPAYSSDIRGVASESLTARTGKLTDAVGDEQEDRSAYLRSNDPVTWTGTQLQFTADIVLEVVNTKSGTPKTATILLSNSPITLANGESAWVLIDRTLASENLTVNLSGTLAVPAQTQANKDVIIIARRQDALGAGYVHLPLHKQVLEPGQTVRLGASGSGDGGGNEILESLKNQFVDSYFDLLTPNIFKVDKETKVDGASTGDYSLIDKTFNFAASTVQTMLSTDMLDPEEFMANTNALAEIELSVYWRLANIDTTAVYEVSRNGGLAWQTVTMGRVGTTDMYRGFHKFTDEVTNQTLYSPAISGDLDASNQLSQSFVVVSGEKKLVKSTTLTLTKTGSPAGYIYVSICADNAGSPGTVLSESAAIVASSLTTGSNVINIPDIYLAAGTYHIKVRTDAAYKASYVNGVTELNLSASSVVGIDLDLRLRISSSSTAGIKKLEGYGLFYDKALAANVASGSINVEVFEFSGNLNTYEFTLTKFVPHADLLKVYDVNTGQVYDYGAFGFDGQKVVFESGQFYQPGQTIKLRFIQVEGSAFDSSDVNGLLLASNHLGSTDASIDRSLAGRGIFLRRPDGTLREIALDDSDNIVVYSV
jgi:hypothetical protein